MCEGSAFRFKALNGGRRQILSFLLPGAFIGMQQKMGDATAQGKMTLIDTTFGVCKRDAQSNMRRRSLSMRFNITWLVALKKLMVDHNLLSVS